MGSLSNPYMTTSYVKLVQEDIQSIINDYNKKNIKFSIIDLNLKNIPSHFSRTYTYRNKKVLFPSLVSLDINNLKNRMKRKFFSTSEFPLLIEENDKIFYKSLVKKTARSLASRMN